MKVVIDLDLDFGYVTKLVLAWIWFWIWRIIRDIYEIVIDFEAYVWLINTFIEIYYVFKAHMWTFEWNMLYVCVKYG